MWSNSDTNGHSRSKPNAYRDCDCDRYGDSNANCSPYNNPDAHCTSDRDSNGDTDPNTDSV